MRFSLGLNAQAIQTQTQKLSPRMIQSMEILQLNALALEERIDQELTENPTLEVQEKDPATPEESSQNESTEATADERELVVEGNNEEDFERLVDMVQDVPDHFDEQPRRSSNYLEEQSDRKHDAMANLETRPQTLSDYLLEQLYELDIAPNVRLMSERIISTLDPSDGGYFRSSLQDLVPPGSTDDPQTQLTIAQEGLSVVQSLDPAGIAARDLRECLLAQLDPSMLFYEEMRTLIDNHLEDLQHNRMPVIERKTGYSIAQIKEAWEHLKKLNPKPGATFVDSHAAHVTPDIFVEKDSSGRYKVIIEDDHTPSLYISNYYRQRLANGSATPEEREFIKRKINSAQWLIESIEQRRNTLTNVAQSIVDHQQKFLDEGDEYIEPLKMQQIADKVGVHVTTVSRAVDDKWIQTPRGLFKLKRFFVGGTQNAQGEDVAWDKIRIKLQEIVDNEDKTKPLSDDQLVDELNKHGLKVARRTVTKYRKKMGIPSSRQRREWVTA